MSRKKKKKRRNNSKRKRNKKINYKQLSFTFILIILILILSYLIIYTNLLKPKINELTTSYISFNNKNATDMLKIVNLEKMDKERGMSNLNNSTLDFKVTGDKNTEYDIIIYPITNEIDYKYINYSLNSSNKILKEDNFSNLEDSSDEGKIIYKGSVDNTKFTLKMWINNKYNGKINDNSFEVKIKPR